MAELDITPSGGSQSYGVFVYNSSGSQSRNRFSSWSDLMTAIALQDGNKVIQFEQNETIPAGAWNLDYCTLMGNGKAYDSGGFTITIPTGVTISSWLGSPVVDSLRILCTSTGAVWTTAIGFLFAVNTQAELWATSAPFILNTGGGQCIISLGRAGRLKDNGYPVFETTAGAFGTVIVLTRSDSSTLADNTMKSSAAVVFLDLVQSTLLDLSGASYPSTHTGLTIGVDFSSIQNYRSTIVGLKAIIADGTSLTPLATASVNQQGNAQIAGNLTINAPTGYKTTQSEIELWVIAVNTQTYVWNAIYRGSTSLALPVSCIGGKTDRIKFSYNDTDNKWDLIRYIGGL